MKTNEKKKKGKNLKEIEKNEKKKK